MPWNSAAQGGGGPVEDSGGLVEGGRRSTHEKARMLSIRAFVVMGETKCLGSF